MTKKLISLLLAVLMVLSITPTVAIAEQINRGSSSGEEDTVDFVNVFDEEDAYEEVNEGAIEGEITGGEEKLFVNPDYPVAKDLTYDGDSHLLISNYKESDAYVVATTGKTRYQYRVNGGDWVLGSSVDQCVLIKNTILGKDAGDYKVDYRKQVYEKTGKWSYDWITKDSTTITVTIKQAENNATVTGKTGLAYNGSAQTLIDTATAAHGDIYYQVDGGTWSKNKASATNKGTYAVNWKAGGGNYKEVSGSFNVEIAQGTNSGTVTGKSNLSYNNSDQELIDTVTVAFGTVQYQVDGGAWSTEKPKRKAGGTYAINWKVEATTNYTGLSGSFNVEIALERPSVTVTGKNGLVYSGENQQLINTAMTNKGTIKYSLDNTNWETDITKVVGKDAGDYTVYYKVEASESWSEATGNITVNIAKADLPANAVVKAEGLVYNGKAQNLVVENLPAGANAYYKTGYVVGSSTDESDAIPTETDVCSALGHDNYYVYYRIDGGKNYKNKDYDKGSVGIWKLDFKVSIEPASLADIEFNETVPFAFDGSAKSVTIKKVLAGKEGDYVEVPSKYYRTEDDSVSSATNPGTYAVKIEVDDDIFGTDPVNFTGSTSKNWTINKSYKFTDGALEIKDADGNYSVSDAKFEVTGSNITPEIRVTADGGTLTNGTDYEVVVEDSTTTAKAIGKYTIKVKGKGDYADSGNIASANWEITPIQLKTVEISFTSVMYDGDNHIPTVTSVKDTKGNTVSSDDYTVSYKIHEGAVVTEAINANTYDVVVTAKDGTNHSGSASASFTITKSDYIVKNVATLITANTELKYNGEDQELVTVAEELSGTKFAGITIKFKTRALDEGSTTIPTGKDAYSDATTQIEYPVFFRIDGGNNYESVPYKQIIEGIDIGYEPNFKITIAKGDPTVTITPYDSLVYNGSAQELIESASVDFGTLQLNYRKSGDTDWLLADWITTDSVSSIVGTDAADYEIKYKVDSDINWNAVESDGSTVPYVTATIAAKAIELSWITTVNLPWNGEEQETTITVTDPELGELTENEDYTVSGDRVGTDEGEYTVTITGIGNYSGEVDKTWKILDIKVELDEDEFTYDTTTKTVTPVVTSVSGTALTENVDYEIVTEDSTLSAIHAGEYTVKVKGIGEFVDAGEFDLTWEIKPAELVSGDLTIDQNFFIWTGDEKNVVPTVKHKFTEQNTAVLVSGMDFEFTEDSVTTTSDSGDHYVKIKGTNDYTGELSVKWTIQGLPITHIITTLEEDTFNYNGKPISPKVKIIDLGLLTGGVDYVIEGDTTATNAGEYTISVKGKGKFYGEIKLKWTIKPRDLADCTAFIVSGVTGLPKDTYEYLNTDLLTYKTDMIVVDLELLTKDEANALLDAIEGGSVLDFFATVHGANVKFAYLTAGTDYELSGDFEHKANEKGTYYITATGKGNNYTGSNTKEWVIALQNEMVKNDEFRVANDKQTYSGEAVKPQLQVKNSEGVWVDVDTSKYNITDRNGKAYGNISETNAGTYKLVIKGNENSGKYGSKLIEWTIEKKTVTAKWENTEANYDGNEHRPTLVFDGIVEKDKSKITASKALAISPLPPVHAGTYYMYSKVEFKDETTKNNYNFVMEGQEVGKETISRIRTFLKDNIDKSIKDKLSEILGLSESDEYFVMKFLIHRRVLEIKWENTELTYNGHIQVPTATPTNVVKGDYCVIEVEGGKKDVGKYTARVKGLSVITGLIDDYKLPEGEITCDYEIKQKDIDDKTITCVSEPLVYNTEIQKAKFVITDLEALAALKLDKDYEIIDDETNVFEAIDAGKYSFKIKGIGNYTGETTVQWQILPKNIMELDVLVKLKRNTFVYNGKDQSPEIIGMYHGTSLVEDIDFYATGTTSAKDVYNILGITDYTIYIHGKGNYCGIVQRDWDIIPLDLSKVTPVVTLEELSYNARYQVPKIVKLTVNGDEIPLDEVMLIAMKPQRSIGEYDALLRGGVKLNRFLNFNVVGAVPVKWSIDERQRSENPIILDGDDYNEYNPETGAPVIF